MTNITILRKKLEVLRLLKKLHRARLLLAIRRAHPEWVEILEDYEVDLENKNKKFSSVIIKINFYWVLKNFSTRSILIDNVRRIRYSESIKSKGYTDA